MEFEVNHTSEDDKPVRVVVNAVAIDLIVDGRVLLYVTKSELKEIFEKVFEGEK